MLRSKCPWCSEKVSVHQLGTRNRKVKPKWYQFTRQTSVCPYCNNSVKIDQKQNRWVLLMVPLFVLMFSRTFVGEDILPVSPYNEISFALATAGFLIAVFKLKLIKDADS